MRVGLPRIAGSRLQPLLLVAVLLLAVPAAAGAQEPAAVVFDETPARVTSATSATFAFSADGAASFACATDGAPVAPCPSPFTIDGLAQGSHTFAVRALDAAGGTVAEGGFTWVIDLDKPTATILTGPSGTVPTGKAVVTFESLDADLARLECQLGVEPYDKCTSPLDVEVEPGLNVLRVRAVDEAGNLGEPDVLEWTGAEPAPAKPSLAGPPAQTASRDATFTFTAAGAQNYACTLDGLQLADCASPQKVTVDKDGKHTFEVRGIAPGGAEGPATSLTWTVDTGQPAVTLAASPAKLTNSGVAAFVLASEPGVTLTCRLVRPGGSDPFAPCGTSKTYEGLGSGSYTFEVQAVDAVGNSGAASHSWRVDQDAPTVTITARPPEVSTDASAELAFLAGEEGSSLSCALDGGEFAPCESPVTVQHAVLGPRAFAVRATDAAGNTGPAEGAAWRVAVEAAFDWVPAAAVVDQPVTFTSRSKGAVAGLAWDLDDDGDFDDATGATAQRTFAEAGTYKIRLRVTHPSGKTAEAEADVTVGRTPLTTIPPGTSGGTDARPPVAGFVFAPQAPVAGQDVTLSSTSSDPDGTIAGVAWDLDGDGQFDDASGPAATRAFPEGTHLVGLRVVDSDGLAATSFATVVVGAAPGSPAAPAAPPAPAPRPKALALLKPFPTVRIAGTAVGRRIQLRIFAVKAPRNTTVDVRCRGRGCPFTLDRHRIKGRTRTVRIRRLERRALRAGIVIEVRVHAPGRVGKYTRLLMRSAAAPKRTDACVSGTRRLKVACPA
ncbi:MAG: hypothetical protein AVDCRST_MAG79-2984 [uncultured Thermoleophilia bacterium]|uniref:PKD domain-containing protein n=1 Tax=uncultured Thermoleophilia bacterium TaxID=1497501 RepID=A0A6J4UPE3_9ACTN|nr:MAG: hypothetical protein AVDCRST_MAG79-2984 [uncultured Thermoleophilia bacterium]